MTRDKRPYLRLVPGDKIEDIKQKPKTRLEQIMFHIKSGCKTRKQIYMAMHGYDEGTTRLLIRQGINKGLIREKICQCCNTTRCLELVK